MRQDDTGEAISAVGIPSLTRALERESGLAEDEVSGDDSALLARVDKEYQRYFTAAKGNPAGEYKDAAAALARAEEEYTEATRVLRELDSVVERYEQLERDQFPDPSSLTDARRDQWLVLRGGIRLERFWIDWTTDYLTAHGEPR